MRGISTTLLLKVLRATLESLEQNRQIDRRYFHASELRATLEREIKRIEDRDLTEAANEFRIENPA